MPGPKDPWVILGLERSATDEQIRDSYRKLAREYHPDRNRGDTDKQLRFTEISRAYNQIGTAPARATWLLENEPAGSTFKDSAGFFDDYPAPGSQQRPQPPRGNKPKQTINHEISVEFHEAVNGTQRNITLELQVPCRSCGSSGAEPGQQPVQCNRCHGRGEHTVGGASAPCIHCDGRGYTVARPCPICSGKGHLREKKQYVVAIPPGIKSGQVLRLPLPQIPNYENPEVLITVEVKESPVFRRTLADPADLLIIVPVSFAEAALGANVKIPTLDKNVQLRIPAGTPSGKAFRIPGKGLRRINSESNGDLYARVLVVVPEKLSEAQSRAITQLSLYDSKSIRDELFQKITGGDPEKPTRRRKQ